MMLCRTGSAFGEPHLQALSEVMLWKKNQNSVRETGTLFVDKFSLTLLQSARSVQLRSCWQRIALLHGPFSV